MTTDNEPLGLDDEPQASADNQQPAKDNDGIPYCRSHHCRMKQTGGGRKGSRTAYYACPVKGCEEKQQTIRTVRPGVVPPQPLACPHCRRRKQAVYCERDPERSTAAMVILRCPQCGWKSSGFAVPQLAAAHFARGPEREPEPGIGAR